MADFVCLPKVGCISVNLCFELYELVRCQFQILTTNLSSQKYIQCATPSGFEEDKEALIAILVVFINWPCNHAWLARVAKR